MKKILTLMFGMAMALMLSVSTASAWHISVEPISIIPDCEAVDIGATFYADVFFNPDAGGNFLDAYGFAVGFDTTELSWVAATAAAQHTPPPPSGMIGIPLLEEPGYIGNFSAVAWGSGTTLTAKTRLAHIEFIAEPDMYCDGLLDVFMRPDIGLGGAFHVDDIEVLWGDYDIVQGPSVSITGNPVPIPGAIMLLVPGFLGAIAIHRKKRS